MAKPLEKKLAQYLNVLPLNILIFDARGKIIFINAAAKKEFTFLRGETFSYEQFSKHIVTVNERPFTPEIGVFKRVLKHKKVVNNVREAMDVRRRRHIYLVSGAPIIKDNKVNRIILTLENVTIELKQQDLQRMYIRTVGHELKQPLGLVKAYTHFLKKALISGKTSGVSYIQKINKKVKQIATILDDLTDATKFSLSTFEVHKREFELLIFMRQTVAELRMLHQGRNIVYRQHIQNKNFVVYADRARLRQVVVNLVTNAVKFSTPEKPVGLELRQLKDRVSISVTDKGIGIKKTEMGSLFRPFYRSKSKKISHVQGLGLGLALVKSIVERHGGTIEVTSKYGVGSRFTVYLPYQA